MPRYNQKIKLLKKILRDALFFINWKKLNNTVEIAITGIYTHHETIRNVHMYKHIQNQNEIKKTVRISWSIVTLSSTWKLTSSSPADIYNVHWRERPSGRSRCDSHSLKIDNTTSSLQNIIIPQQRKTPV